MIDRREELMATVAALLAQETLDDVGYDIGPVLVPGPDGSLMAGYLLVLSARSPVLVPPRMTSSNLFSEGWPDEATLRAGLKQALKSLAEVRQRLLAPAN